MYLRSIDMHYYNSFYKTTIVSILIIIFITSCISINTQPDTRLSQNVSVLQSAPHTSKVSIELFVMSECPYSIEAEKAIIPMIKGFQDQIDFHLWFIAEEVDEETVKEPSEEIPEDIGAYEEEDPSHCKGEAIYEGGRFKSLHGKSEIEEGIRQLVMVKYYPDKFSDYLLCRTENYSTDQWEECATKAWMDTEFISKVSQSEEGEMLFSQNIKKANELKIYASPTLFINGKRFKGRITGNNLGREICRSGHFHASCRSIPVCGSDSDCRAEGKVGICINPETVQATCRFTQPVNFGLTLIKPEDCDICTSEEFVETLKGLFPGMDLEELKDDSDKAKKLISDLGIKVLPAFYFDEDITKTVRYARIKERLQKTADGFLWDSKYLKVSYLLNTEEKKGDIKLFVESLSPETIVTEDFLIKEGLFREAAIDIHYLAQKANPKRDVEILTITRDKDNPGVLQLSPRQDMVVFKSPKGLKEVQKDIRQLCISRYYPEQYIDYLSCINKDLLRNLSSRAVVNISRPRVPLTQLS